MAITQTISTIPDAGHRGVDTRNDFVTKQEAFQDALVGTAVSELNIAFSQINSTETNINNKEASATAAALTATAAASTAQATANASLWVSGQSYTTGQNSISLIDFQTYRATENTSGTTDPSLSGSWTKLSSEDNSKLPLSGGTMTGAITGLKETSVAMPANDINLATGNLFTKTTTGATTLTVSNVPVSGTVGYFILQLTNGGAGAITWFSGVKWAGGTPPTLTASGKDILSFYTIDAGTTWNIVSIQKDVK